LAEKRVIDQKTLIIKNLFATEVTETTERFVFKKQKKKVNP